MTITSGFFNSKNGDRKYNAEQMSKYFDKLVTSGVFPNPSNQLQVMAVSGMEVKVLPGRGLIDCHWVDNSSDYSLTIEKSDAVLNRIDAIVVRLDLNEDVRSIQIVVKKGDPSNNPTPPAMIRTDYIQEYCLATVSVEKLATEIKQENITDSRADTRVCGWVTGLIDQVDTSTLFVQWQDAYERFYNESNDIFSEWFQHLKETVSTATLIRTFTSVYTTKTQDEVKIPIGIERYNSELDILNVFINGLKLVVDLDFTIEALGKNIILTRPVDSGTPIAFEVLKSVDGSNAETIVDTVFDMQADKLVDDKYVYYTTGDKDNEKLSAMCKSLVNSWEGVSQIKIEIRGDNFKMGSPISGSGTTTSRYKWFDFGAAANSASEKQIILDFGKCQTIKLTDAKTNSIVFFGSNVQIENLSFVVQAGTNVTFVENASVVYKNCHVVMRGAGTMCFARMAGSFEDCRTDVRSSNGEAYCFATTGKNFIRVTGGTHKAYTGVTGTVAAAFYAPSGQDNSIILMTNCNCPITPITGLYQSNTVKINSGKYAMYGNILGTAASIYSNTAGVESGTVILSIEN